MVAKTQLSIEEQRRAAEAKLHQVIGDAVKAGFIPVDEGLKTVREELAAISRRTEALEKNKRAIDLPGSEDARRKDGETFSTADVVASLACGGVRRGYHEGHSFDATMEWEMSDEIARSGGNPNSRFDQTRAANETDTGAGGAFLVPGAVLTEKFIPLLRPRVIAFELGAQQESFNTFPIEIPREVTATTAGGAQENVALAESEPTFGQLSMRPHACGSFAKVSRRFMSYGAGASNLLNRIIAREIGIKWNSWYLKGLGINDEPLGIYLQSGNSVAVTNAQTYAQYLELLKVPESLVIDNVPTDGAKWATCAKFARYLRGYKSEDADAGAHGDFARTIVGDANAKTILGFPYVETSQLASAAESEVIFGDFSQSMIASFGTMMLEASNTANDALQKRQTHVAAWLDIDIGVLQPNAFCVITGLDLASF